MYLIKEVGFTLNRELCVRDGIRAKLFTPCNRVFICEPFWGMADVEVEAHTDFSKFGKLDGENEVLFSYANSVNVKWLGAEYKELSFYVSSYQPARVDGYIIVVPACWKIETIGQKIAGRTPKDGVFFLKEGQWIEVEGKRIEVIQGELVY